MYDLVGLRLAALGGTQIAFHEGSFWEPEMGKPEQLQPWQAVLHGFSMVLHVLYMRLLGGFMAFTGFYLAFTWLCLGFDMVLYYIYQRFQAQQRPVSVDLEVV